MVNSVKDPIQICLGGQRLFHLGYFQKSVFCLRFGYVNTVEEAVDWQLSVNGRTPLVVRGFMNT